MNLLMITSELAASEEITCSDLLNQISQSVIAIYPDGIPVIPWAGYLAILDGKFVGSCAFKTPLTADGEVEIAYFTFPEHEAKGIATKMAKELINMAVNNGARCIKAQTLPTRNASVHILEKLGFQCKGVVNHPEDGDVWDWCKVIA